MMTQANLLDLAKQGNPQAIAALMNLTLHPKGVTAQATLQDGWLHVFLDSKELLNRAAIVQFVNHGLAALASPGVQQVKLYARQEGNDTPLWVEAFRVGQVPVAAGVQAGSVMAGVAAPGATGSVGSEAPKSQTSWASQLKVPQFEPLSGPGLSPVPGAMMVPAGVPQGGAIQGMPQGGAANGIVHTQGGGPGGYGPGQTRRRPMKRRRRGGSPMQRAQGMLHQFIYKVRTSNRYAMGVAIAASAFIGGGIVAMVATAQKPNPQVPMAVAPSNQLSGGFQSPELQQAQATQYLAQMNRAQQAFYQTNGRLASNLDELERSASIISRAPSYTYTVTAVSQLQGEITAVPQMGGLKSYISVVRFGDMGTANAAPTNLICGSNQPAKAAPSVAPSANGSLQCSPDASPVAGAVM
jgi:hypothetical protein